MTNAWQRLQAHIQARDNGDVLSPRFNGPMDPVYPCREMPTRHCPAAYDAECGDRPCARFQSTDETPWVPEVIGRHSDETSARG